MAKLTPKTLHLKTNSTIYGSNCNMTLENMTQKQRNFLRKTITVTEHPFDLSSKNYEMSMGTSTEVLKILESLA